MFNIGPLELMVILIVALLVVGPSRLPDVGKSIGRGLREFRRAQDEVQRTLRLSLDDENEPASKPMRSAAAKRRTDGDEDGATAGRAEPASPAEAAASAPAEPSVEERGAVEEAAKALGRGLADLRRAKEELRDSFRVDLDDDRGNGSRAR